MLRFGLLGTGYWAAETHAAGLRGHPDADFVGVWGRNPAKAGTIAERYGVRAYSDVDALITDVDALAVALAPDVQADLARRAARAGRHLLLDKPVALSLSAADALVEAVDAAGVSALVFTTNRYRPEFAGFQLAPASVVLNIPPIDAAYTVLGSFGSIASAWTLPPSGPMLVHTLSPAQSVPNPLMKMLSNANFIPASEMPLHRTAGIYNIPKNFRFCTGRGLGHGSAPATASAPFTISSSTSGDQVTGDAYCVWITCA